MGNKLTPGVRFVGFTGDWEQRKLGEISEKVTEKNKDNNYSETLTNSAEFGIINQRDFFYKDISNEKNLDGYYIVRPDDFVYNPRISNHAPVGPIKRNKLGRTGVMSPLYHVFRTHNVDETYLEKYFSSKSWHIFMKLNGDSGARSDRFAIKDSLFREMPIPIPSIEEQTKIGNFLEQLDDNIAIHQQELTTLKQTKQGFLQKMFPIEGESVPEVRFPGFTDAWEQRRLGEITSLITKGTTPLDKSWIGPVNYIKTESIDSLSGNITIKANTSLEEHEGYLKRSQLKENDVLFSIVGTLGRVGIVEGKDLPANTNQQIAIIRLKDSNTNFILNALKTNNVQSFIKSDSTIGAQPSLSLWQINDLQISVPILEEQVKIGQFFTDFDNLITLHQRELDALQETKKAFLQKMFA